MPVFLSLSRTHTVGMKFSIDEGRGYFKLVYHGMGEDLESEGMKEFEGLIEHFEREMIGLNQAGV